MLLHYNFPSLGTKKQKPVPVSAHKVSFIKSPFFAKVLCRLLEFLLIETLTSNELEHQLDPQASSPVCTGVLESGVHKLSAIQCNNIWWYD